MELINNSMSTKLKMGKKKGFTLIELIIVIAIIAIIAAIAVPRISKAMKSSTEKTIRDELTDVQQAIIEAKMANTPATTAFTVKNNVYSRGMSAEIPSSLGTESATIKSTDLVDVTVGPDSITISMPRGAGAGKVGQVIYLGDKDNALTNESASTASIPVRDTALVTDTKGIRPIVDDRTLGNKKYMTLLYKGLGITSAGATTLGDMDRTKQTQAMQEIFGDTTRTGKNGVEPILEIKQVDIQQIAPYLTNITKIKDSSKYVVYQVVSTNRTGNMTTNGTQGFGTNLITPSVAEEITNSVVPGDLILMPTSMDSIVYTQTSGYKEGIFTISK
ncbi:prepilin-type N-terminal cleavage/methylation domain-containing protein [Clostridium tertium]|uniref:prepilin-type N-terminal cleavage/methylation domain-containing protein n=1 Tax=Clostridium tertium TaxID=1559 RepID=UPI003B986A15